MPTRPLVTDDAVCIANPRQFQEEWIEDEAASSSTFWAFTVLTTVLSIVLAYYLLLKHNPRNGEVKEGQTGGKGGTYENAESRSGEVKEEESGGKSGIYASAKKTVLSVLDSLQLNICSLVLGLKVYG